MSKLPPKPINWRDKILDAAFATPRRAAFTIIGLSITVVGALYNPLWTDEEGAAETIKSYGFTLTRVGGYQFFSCSKGERFHTSFEAINEKGEPIRGVVCRGFFFRPAIRLDN